MVLLLFPTLVIGATVLPSLAARFSFARHWARIVLRIAGVRLQISGKEHFLHLTAPAILVANHASYIDVIALAAALPGTFRVIAKKEFEANWFLGPFFRRLGGIFVERFAPQAAIEDSRSLEKSVREGQSLLLFPEGTFTSQAGLRPFRMGAFVIASQTGTPVIPVALQGTRSVLHPDRWLPHRHPVRITVLSPIYPNATGWGESLRLRSAARQAIASACGEPELTENQG